jgi:hypothetical protein
VIFLILLQNYRPALFGCQIFFFCWRHGFNPRPVHIGFVVKKCGIGREFLSKYFCFPLSVSFSHCSIPFNASIPDAVNCATGRKVAGSIPNVVFEFFHWLNHSGPTVVLGRLSLNRNEYQESSLGVEVAGAWGWQPCHLGAWTCWGRHRDYLALCRCGCTFYPTLRNLSNLQCQ